MVKKVGGGQRFKAAAKAAAAGQAAPASQPTGPLPPQHVQRKVNRKVKFLEKVAASQKASIAATGRGVAKKYKRKAKALPTLDSLAGVLDELAGSGKGGGTTGSAAGAASGKAKHLASKGRGSSVKRLKARQVIALSETHRLQQVIEHPSYKADPLAAIAHHLQATLPPPPKPKAGAAAGKQQRKGPKKPKGPGGSSMQTD